MLEEIIDKTSSKDDKDLPKSLPSPHLKYVTQKTTFGRVRVDLPSKPEQRKMIEELYKTYDPNNEEYRKFDTRIWSLVDDDTKKNQYDIDFYGLINAHYRNIIFEETLSAPKEPLTDNYIDQLAFPELTTEKKTQKVVESKPLDKETIEDLKTQPMNFIDEQYFGTLKQIEYQQKPADSTKRVEMPPAEELNYIDQLVFSSPKPEKPTPDPPTKQANSDKLLDINFQFRISTPKPKPASKPAADLTESPMDSYNPKLETMRSIKPKDYFDPPRQSALDVQKEIESDKTATQPAEHIRQQLIKKTSVRDSLGYRTFESLVPKWWTMTKAEIVDILIKQICFIRRKILSV
jgi:hypothetical protein